MSYPLSATLLLGAGNTGLTLTAALFDSANAAAAGLTTSTLVETDASTGIYLWTGTVPDDHRGLIKFSSAGVVKTAVSVNSQELENPDVKTSTVAALSATAVWAAGTRTLTSFGTLVADVAAAVWSYATRTLTTAIAAVTPPPVVSGETVTVLKGDTWNLPFTDLGDLTGNTKLWLTVKREYSDTDSEATLQIERTVGLQRLNGAAATASEGSATVIDAPTGDVTFAVDEAATVQVEAGRYYYDVQSLIGGTVRTHTRGRYVVAEHVTTAIS